MFATVFIAGVPSVDLSLLLSFLQTLFSFLSLIKLMEDNDMTNSMLVGSGARSGPNCWGNLSNTFQALCRFDTCPFHLETAKKAVSFFIPPVPTLRMNPCMTRLTQRHEISLVMRPALRQWQLVVYLLNRTQNTFLVTLLTERMLCSVTVTDSFPCPPIPTAYSRVTVVLLVAAVLLFLMLLTEPPVRQLRASGEGTRSLRFPWHCSHLLAA